MDPRLGGEKEPRPDSVTPWPTLPGDPAPRMMRPMTPYERRCQMMRANHRRCQVLSASSSATYPKQKRASFWGKDQGEDQLVGNGLTTQRGLKNQNNRNNKKSPNDENQIVISEKDVGPTVTCTFVQIERKDSIHSNHVSFALFLNNAYDHPDDTDHPDEADNSDNIAHPNNTDHPDKAGNIDSPNNTNRHDETDHPDNAHHPHDAFHPDDANHADDANDAADISNEVGNDLDTVRNSHQNTHTPNPLFNHPSHAQERPEDSTNWQL